MFNPVVLSFSLFGSAAFPIFITSAFSEFTNTTTEYHFSAWQRDAFLFHTKQFWGRARPSVSLVLRASDVLLLSLPEDVRRKQTAPSQPQQ
jgi:hypothetical protein